MSAHSVIPRLSSGAESVTSAPGIESSTMASNPSSMSLEEFSDKHLAQPPEDYEPSYDYWRKKLLPDIKNHQGHEHTLYDPICKLLNAISRSVHRHYAREKTELHCDHLIVFLDHHASPPSHCNIGFDQKPDLVAVNVSKKQFGSYQKNANGVYYGVPCYHIISAGECKPGDKPGNPQANRYTWQLLKDRPDMPGVYGFCANIESYSIIWSDPSGPSVSPSINWNNLDPLVAYICSLYVPPKDHHLWDPTITSPTLHVPKDQTGAKKKRSKPHWNIEYDDKIYKNCDQIHAGDSWGRRTTVFMHGSDSNDPNDFAVIKDTFRDDKRRFEEASLLKHIHSQGTIPGVVRLLASGEVNGCDGSLIHTARPPVKENRTKKRLIMGSRGDQLSAAKSVKDLLMTVYDGTEVHRTLVIKRGYLHRDISFYNFFMYPKHARDTLSEKGFAECRPVFISEILGIPSDSEDKCRALFIDADNSALIEATDGITVDSVNKELAFRTGTPRYIARAVASGMLVNGTRAAKAFFTMPELEGKAKEVYINTYGQEAYDAYTDVAANTYHGRKVQKDSQKTPHFYHRPDHDMESLFWVLAFSLIFALPLNASDEPSSTYSSVWKTFRNHTIVRGNRIDERGNILEMTAETWTDLLHPKLASVVNMMMKLAEQVAPEYGFLDAPPKEDHLHEAFRRILLEQILSMEDDPILLTPNRSREPPLDEREGQDRGARMVPSFKAESTQAHSKKRKAGDEDEDENASVSRKAAKPASGVFSSSLHSAQYLND